MGQFCIYWALSLCRVACSFFFGGLGSTLPIPSGPVFKVQVRSTSQMFQRNSHNVADGFSDEEMDFDLVW
jgi:hypothetical protein